MSPRPAPWKRAWPERNKTRLRPKVGARSTSDMAAAYARVGEAVGLSAAEIKQTWLAVKKGQTPGSEFTKAHFDAMTYLREAEKDVEDRITKWQAHANRFHDLVRGERRFLYMHTKFSPYVEFGYPDATLLDRLHMRLYWWENKREDAVPAPIQQVWLDDLAMIQQLTGGLVVQCLGVIRPSNVGRIIRPLFELPGHFG